MRLRTTNVLRSRSIPADPAGSVTTSWRNDGITARAHAEAVGTHRHVAPGDDGEALVLDDALDRRLRLLAAERLDRQEHETDGVVADRREVVAELRAQEAVGDLDEDAGAVAGVGLGSGAPRWSRLHSAPSAVSTMPRLATPLRWATKDTPHESCSKRGS